MTEIVSTMERLLGVGLDDLHDSGSPADDVPHARRRPARDLAFADYADYAGAAAVTGACTPRRAS